MYLFFETIKIIDGLVQNLHYHQKRMNETLNFHFKDHCIPPLVDIIDLPEELKAGTVKCRIDYSSLEYIMTLEKYIPKKVENVKVIIDNIISYNFKYCNRENINNLHMKKGTCDDILIVRSGLITDTSFSNIIFNDGYNWHTPATPLLKGTCRARLLYEGKILEKKISLDDLGKYHYFKLINSMLNDDLSDFKPISSILI